MATNKVEIEVVANTGKAGPALKGVADDVGAIAPAAGKAQASSELALGSMYTRGIKASEAAKSISEQLAFIQKAYVGLQATQGMQAIVFDLAKTADAYNNLQARIKLVTGEGAPFEAAFEGIAAVALRTSSSLDSTGNLFAKLATAGKEMGIGQAEALKLTETVNQAVQLSGASASASDAAITQLIQGLQSGVLRGDEFNSIMEQAPRLSRALADSLGVTTGELRKMAEAGQLTSETVIKALQGQADTVASEFGKLPPTVGRALQNLSSSWMLYVGETDKATGASKLAATAIGALANNLNTIAGYLLDAGQAAAAFAALKLAQHFTGIGIAATQSATAVAANTVAMTAAGAAGSTAAVGVGRLASILSALKTFTLLGIVTNFHDIGTAIGEGMAKLMGYKDRTEELTRADKVAAQVAADAAEQRKRMAAATQAAIDKQFELTKAGSAAIAEFDKLTKEGASAADAISRIGKDFDLANVPGIKNAASVLDKLAANGKISATEFHNAWAAALKGADLAVFETQARAAFAGTTREAERLTQILDATLRESIKRTGLDFDVISGGMGAASRSAINDTQAMIAGLDRLKAMGVDTAQVLTASIGKSITTADSQKAIDALRLQIEAVRKVLGDKVADGLLDQAKQKADALSDALDKAKPGINSLREAMDLLGLRSTEALQRTAKTAQEAFDYIKAKGQEEGESYVAWQARKSDAASVMLQRLIDANGGVVTEAIKARAAMEGVELSAGRAGHSIKGAFDGGSEAANRFTGNARDSLEEIKRMDAVLDAINAKYGQSKADLAGKYSNPGEGPNRSILTKDDMKGVDNSGLFSLQQKNQSGSLTKDDLATAQAVFNAASTNLDMYQKNWSVFSLEGAKSIHDSYNESRMILERVKALDMQRTTSSGAVPTTVAQTVNVRITMPDSSVRIVPTTQNGSQELIAVLQSAKLSSGL